MDSSLGRRHQGTRTRPRVFLSFAAAFNLLTAYYVLKPVRNSLFLKEWSSDQLPLAYLLTAFCTMAAVWCYNHLIGRLSRFKLVLYAYMVFIAAFVVFRVLLGSRSPGVAMAFYVWVSLFSVLAITMFWSFTDDLFNPREGKRYYGFIGSGALLGSVVGAGLTRHLAPLMGTENLIWIAIGLLLIGIVHHVAVSRNDDRLREAALVKAPEVPPDHGQGGLELLRDSRYLQMIAAMVLITTFLMTLVDYQFTKTVEQAIDTKDQRTAYFGSVFAIVNALSWGIQFFLTSRLQRRLGVGPALFVTPGGSFAAAVLAAASPMLETITALKIVGNSLEYSLNQATKELLYLPLAREAKYKAKAFIDAAFFRLGDASSAILILLATSTLDLSLGGFRLINLVLAGAYVFIAGSLRRHYVAALRRVIECRPDWRPEDGEAALAALDPQLRREDFPDDASVYREIHTQARRIYLGMMAESMAADAPDSELRLRLENENDRTLRRLFRLTGFLVPSEELWPAVKYLAPRKNREDAIALEYLDNILPFSIRQHFLPFFNTELPLQKKLDYGRRRWRLTPAEVSAFQRFSVEERPPEFSAWKGGPSCPR